MPTKEDAKKYLTSIVHHHVPSNARQYRMCCYNGDRQISSALGFQVDLSPADGKVVDKNDDWLVVKTARTEFFVAALDLLDVVPDVGATVHIEPYARRGFDGIRLDAPRETVYGSVKMQTFTLGESVSRLPVDKNALQSSYLKDLIEQIEMLPSPDGVRKLCQVLVDAGAYQGPVCFKDPSDEDCVDDPAWLEFVIKTQKFDGVLQIGYDRAMDYYYLSLLQHDQVVRNVANVTFDELAPTIIELVDDGAWKLAKVTITKPAPKQAKKAA